MGDEVYGVKWRNWKMVVKTLERGFAVPVDSYPTPLIYNLYKDPKEQFPMQEAEKDLWGRYPASQALIEHVASLRKEPPIPLGQPDPYVPGK